jgi:imidazole glycerol-phosphate synthase subunit HisF
MPRFRVIPTLLYYEDGLYKTKKFNLKKRVYIGDPVNIVKLFNDKQADEIVFLDIGASKNNTKPDFDLINNISSECFMPLAYGGGLSCIIDIDRVIKIGVEKVILNSILLENITLIKEASKAYGSQSIVAAIDIKKDIFGRYRIYDSSKSKFSKVDLIEHINAVQFNGAGEIYLTFVDRENTYLGYDIKGIEYINEYVNVPIIINGGARNLQDFKGVMDKFNIPAVSAGSMFIFSGPHEAVLVTYPDRCELNRFLKK